MRHHDKIFGLFLIFFGLFFFIDSLNILDHFSRYVWPVILLLISGALHVAFFQGGGSREKAGMLVPAGVLLVLGLLFLFKTGWRYAGITWPIYMLSAAFGLFEMWLFGLRERNLLLPVLILSGLSLYFIAERLFHAPAGVGWPILAIAFGIYYVVKTPKQKE